MKHIRQIKFGEHGKILVLAPHPDDFDEIAVTMHYFYEKNFSIFLNVLSSGASGVQDSYMVHFSGISKQEKREQEQRQSCRYFGLGERQVSFLRLQLDDTGHLLDCDENLHQIRNVINQMKPDIICCPHENDTNQDHRLTVEMAERALQQGEQSTIMLLNRDPKTISMKQDVFTPFDEQQAQWKAQMLRFHDSQHQRNLHTRGYGFDERILRVNRESAREYDLKEKYAEVFETRYINK